MECQRGWPVDVESVQWLLTDDGQRVLAAGLRARRAGPAAGPLRARTSLPRYAVRAAGRGADPGRAAHAGPSTKFGDLAASMYFTPDGLEQATRLSVATHRAARLKAFGASTVVDLGCGIGGDLLAFARAGITAAGVDLDPVRVAVASANLAALGLPGAVGVADALEVDIIAVRRGLRRPGAAYRPGPDVLAGRLDPAVVLRRVAAGRRGLREDRPGHPARGDPRRRRGRVGQRPRRGEGGRALGRPARHRRPPRHGDPATAAWPR